jgi:parvulin-like peptidyl-prolyl isomerase
MNCRIIQRSIVLGTALLFHFPFQSRAADAPALFAADTAALTTTNPASAGAAAIVDGHIISMEEVALKCLREYRSFIVDQMLQHYILDREFKKRGITVEADIDRRIAELRTNLAPATLEDTLKTNQVTMAEVREDIRFEIEKRMLVADQLKPLRMVHCRELVVTFGSSRSESNALAMATNFRRQILGGADFDAMVAQHSEGGNRNGELGVLYDHVFSAVQAAVLNAALALKQGELSEPIKADDGYHLVKAVSTDERHPPSENPLYVDAADAARRQQISFLVPETMSALIDKCKISFVDDNDLVAGKPLPEAAASIDEHPIPMKAVLDKCMAMYGSRSTHILVQNYIVDRECEKRGLIVKESELDERVEALRKQCSPMTLEEGMKIHHTTMAGLRRDFRQEIERNRLAIGRVQPTRMVHARMILARANAVREADVERSDGDAKAQIVAILEQLKAGKRFEELAVRYCDRDDPSKSGDMDIIFPFKSGIDTDVVNAAIAMKKGEISSQPIKTYGGYALLQIISDSDDHASAENASYAKALEIYKAREAQRLIPKIIGDLIKESNVTYYVQP